MTPLDKFNISSVSKKLNGINAKVSIANDVPFPCLALLSNYSFDKRFVKILPNGDVQGGFSKMIISLIDFSFVRSLCASCYSIKSPPAYDPPTLFLLELFRYIDLHQNMDKFLEVLRDKDRGRAYRRYAGIDSHVPTKGTLSNFKAWLGSVLYNEIFHILVDIFCQLQMITFNIIAHDGTLFPTRARYRGCTWFLDKCSCINVIDIVPRVKKQIMYRLNNLNKVNLEKTFSITCECPYAPEEKFKDKKPKVEVLSMKLGFSDKPSKSQIHTAMVFGVKVELDLKLELPVAATNISGNGEEGKKIITNTKQINTHHNCQIKIDIADAKYDTIKN